MVIGIFFKTFINSRYWTMDRKEVLYWISNSNTSNQTSYFQLCIYTLSFNDVCSRFEYCISAFRCLELVSHIIPLLPFLRFRHFPEKLSLIYHWYPFPYTKLILSVAMWKKLHGTERFQMFSPSSRYPSFENYIQHCRWHTSSTWNFERTINIYFEHKYNQLKLCSVACKIHVSRVADSLRKRNFRTERWLLFQSP